MKQSPWWLVCTLDTVIVYHSVAVRNFDAADSDGRPVGEREDGPMDEDKGPTGRDPTDADVIVRHEHICTACA